MLAVPASAFDPSMGNSYAQTAPIPIQGSTLKAWIFEPAGQGGDVNPSLEFIYSSGSGPEALPLDNQDLAGATNISSWTGVDNPAPLEWMYSRDHDYQVGAFFPSYLQYTPSLLQTMKTFGFRPSEVGGADNAQVVAALGSQSKPTTATSASTPQPKPQPQATESSAVTSTVATRSTNLANYNGTGDPENQPISQAPTQPVPPPPKSTTVTPAKATEPAKPIHQAAPAAKKAIQKQNTPAGHRGNPLMWVGLAVVIAGAGYVITAKIGGTSHGSSKETFQ